MTLMTTPLLFLFFLDATLFFKPSFCSKTRWRSANPST